MRVRVPFGIAQVGKAFRNEVNPRNFVFRSREFEQMEMEWFCPPEEAQKWRDFWVETRKQWWINIGVAESHLQLRPHEKDELSHYAKAGVGTTDIEYQLKDRRDWKYLNKKYYSKDNPLDVSIMEEKSLADNFD